MAVNSATTVELVIKYRSVFFVLLDEMDQGGLQQGVSEEFTRSFYHQQLKVSVALLDDIEKRRVLKALSIDNLERCGLTVFNDGKSGKFLLVGWLVDMLRHFDSKRLKGLSQPHLDSLHDQIETALYRIKSPKLLWLDGDDDFEEVLGMLYSTLRYVTAQLKQNVAALQGQSRKLAGIVDHKDYSSLSQTAKMKTALESIYTIYERHVIPTLRFLDPNVDIKRRTIKSRSEKFGISRAPMAMIAEIIQRFKQSEKYNHVRQLSRIELQLLSYTSDVSTIREGLEIYIKYADQQRKRYNIIEDRYNKLLAAVEEIQDGRQSGFKLKNSHSVFTKSEVLVGLKVYQQDQTSNIDWPAVGGRDLLDEHIRVCLAAFNNEDVNQARSSPRQKPVGDESRAKKLRMVYIARVMKKLSVPVPCDDLYLLVHQHLMIHLDNYKLPHLFDAIQLAKYDGVMKPKGVKQNISYAGLTLNYHPRYISI